MQSKPSADSQPQDSLDFLDGPRKDEVSTKEREFAHLYVEAFINSAAGAQLLAHWEETLFWKPTPTNAPHTQYAADESLRQFIRGIRGQIKQVAQGRAAQ